MSAAPPATQPTREVVLVTGISGSGKSVALHALEDAGYFCVDNLPPELLREFVRLEHARDTHRVAVAVDVAVLVGGAVAVAVGVPVGDSVALAVVETDCLDALVPVDGVVEAGC
jgi:broad-specificity NMP kinase